MMMLKVTRRAEVGTCSQKVVDAGVTAAGKEMMLEVMEREVETSGRTAVHRSQQPHCWPI